MADVKKRATVHAWPACRNVALAELRSDQAFTVISVVTPATENRVHARALIRLAMRDTLAAFFESPIETILLDPRPGQPLQVDSERGCMHVSFSHMPGLSVAAIGRVSTVGVDLMQVDTGVLDLPDWRRVAWDYLGPAASDVLLATPPALRPAAFAEAWTSLEACLKCNGQPLTEWNLHLHRQFFLNCDVLQLALPENCRGTIAIQAGPGATACAPRKHSTGEATGADQ